MIHMNKETSRIKSERASVPGILKMERQEKRQDKKNGSVTIEASFAIPLFLFAAICLIWVIEVQSIKISIIHASQNAAKSAAENMAFVPVLNTVKLKSDIISLIGEERIDRSIIEGGSSGISCWKSYVSSGTGEMNITVEYKVRLPLPAFGSPSAELKEKFKLSAWLGYKNGDISGDGGEIVYVTENMAVYHEDYQCSYLHLSVRFVSSDELEEIRNISGGRYHACEKCVFGSAMAGVYVTENGSRYHNSLNCSGLKRTIHVVEKNELTGIGGCSRCSK